MNRKLKSTLGLIALLVIILLAGGIYIFIYQRSDINEKEEKLKELESNSYDTEQLTLELQKKEKIEARLDSSLAARDFNIPQKISQIKFYNFMNDISAGFSTKTKPDVAFIEQEQEGQFFYYEYNVTGGGEYSDVYRMIYAIEHSKELKKIKNVSLSNLVSIDDDGIPSFLVNFNMIVDVYFASDNRFATKDLIEKDLTTNVLYDAFYPLIRNEIPPNLEDLLDVQGARLLALIPDGAFLADSRGNTYLLWEGQEVYLGYLTDIDYENNKVTFILNKGGIIEKVELFLEKERK